MSSSWLCLTTQITLLIIPVWCWAISRIDDDLLLIWSKDALSSNVLILINNLRWTTVEKMQNTKLLPSQGIYVILNFAWYTHSPVAE